MVRLEVRRNTNNRKNIIVSIPVWFDWKLYNNPKPVGSKLVSIPVWFDWKSGAAGKALTDIIVSIPVWFDWKLCLIPY